MNELLSYIRLSLRSLEPEDETRGAFLELEQSLQNGASSLGSRTARTVQGLIAAGDIDRARRLVELVTNLPELELKLDQLAHLHLSRGLVCCHGGDIFKAVDEFNAARVKFEMEHDPVNACRAVNNLGRAYGMLQQWALCERAYKTAQEFAREHDLDRYAAHATHNLAIVMGRQGRWRDALISLRHAPSPMSKSTDPLDRALDLLLKGRILRHLGWPNAALAFLRNALTESSAIGYPRGEALAAEFIGDIYLDMGDHRRATEHFKSALRIGLETAPDGDIVCEAYRRLAEVQYARGDIEGSERSLTESSRLCEQLHDDYERVALLRLKGALALEREDLAASDTHFREAVAECVRSGFQFERALTLECQGFAHQTTARMESAQRYLIEARELYRGLGAGRLARSLERGRRSISRPRPAAPRRAKARLRGAARWEKFGIYSRSPFFLHAIDCLEGVARSELPVLIIGESGVGKELVARALHALSGRTGDLVDINCPAIPETMLESELFGSRRGAFTGAEDRLGLAAAAHRGSLFLDEIGDMPKVLQVKLLRFVETSTYRRVGGRAAHSVDVRLISATNADLDAHVRDGKFRLDLFHRIAASSMVLPPLRERPEDIEFLSEHFLSGLTGGNGSIPTLDRAVADQFRTYDWPGNVRELWNVLASAVIHLGKRRRVTVDMIPERVRGVRPAQSGSRLDAETIERRLAQNGGRISDTARELGISRQTLYRRIDELGVDVERIRGR